jgi:putative salt-induced outer membrane protein YdiY
LRFLFILSLLFSTSLFALVTIAPVDIGSKPGISGNVSGSLSSQSGNTEKDDYFLGLQLQYDQGVDYVTWGRFTYDYGKSNGTKNEDKTYAHLRYIHAIDELKEWSGEIFLQTEQDKFKDINERSLIGAGLRWRFLNSDEWGKGYFGAGGFLEKITYTHPQINPNENNSRLNSYLAFTQTFTNTSKLSFVGYFQPKFDDTSDYVSLQTLELIVPIYGKFNLSLTAKYSYDSYPPIGVKKDDTSYLTSLLWTF